METLSGAGGWGERNHEIIYISALQLFLLNYACSWLYFKPCQCALHTSTKGICHSICQAFNILTHLPANHQQQPEEKQSGLWPPAIHQHCQDTAAAFHISLMSRLSLHSVQNTRSICTFLASYSMNF